jgi:hypothetical protein
MRREMLLFVTPCKMQTGLPDRLDFGSVIDILQYRWLHPISWFDIRTCQRRRHARYVVLPREWWWVCFWFRAHTRGQRERDNALSYPKRFQGIRFIRSKRPVVGEAYVSAVMTRRCPGGCESIESQEMYWNKTNPNTYLNDSPGNPVFHQNTFDTHRQADA